MGIFPIVAWTWHICWAGMHWRLISPNDYHQLTIVLGHWWIHKLRTHYILYIPPVCRLIPVIYLPQEVVVVVKLPHEGSGGVWVTMLGLGVGCCLGIFPPLLWWYIAPGILLYPMASWDRVFLCCMLWKFMMVLILHSCGSFIKIHIG